MGDTGPDLNMVNLVVRDMAASVDFYRRLGVAPPTRDDGDPGPHVELAMMPLVPRR